MGGPAPAERGREPRQGGDQQDADDDDDAPGAFEEDADDAAAEPAAPASDATVMMSPMDEPVAEPAADAPVQAATLEDATVAQFPSKMAELGVDALVKAIRGEQVESLIDSGAALVTKDNVGDFQ